MSENSLLTDIQNWLDENGLAKTTFGKLSVNDGKLISRLMSGGQCLPSTEKKIRSFMSTYSEVQQ